MRSLMPFFKHGRDAFLPTTRTPMPVAPPAPAPWSKHDQPDEAEDQNEEQERDQAAEEPKAKAKRMVIEKRPTPIGIDIAGGRIGRYHLAALHQTLGDTRLIGIVTHRR